METPQQRPVCVHLLTIEGGSLAADQAAARRARRRAEAPSVRNDKELRHAV